MKILAWLTLNVALPLILYELMVLAPLFARWIVKCGAYLIMNRQLADRFKEEWLAGIDEQPGQLTKLVSAVCLVVVVVPKINYLLFDLLYQRTIGARIVIVCSLRNFRTLYSVNPGFRLMAPTSEDNQRAREFDRALAVTCSRARAGDTEQRVHALKELGFLVDNPPPWAAPLASRFGKRALADLTQGLTQRNARLDRTLL